MGQNYKLCFTFMCSTKKAPITDILQPSPYWGHEYVPHNTTIVLIELDMCKPEYSAYVYSRCNFVVDIYACSKFSLSMVTANYKAN